MEIKFHDTRQKFYPIQFSLFLTARVCVCTRVSLKTYKLLLEKKSFWRNFIRPVASKIKEFECLHRKPGFWQLIWKSSSILCASATQMLRKYVSEFKPRFPEIRLSQIIFCARIERGRGQMKWDRKYSRTLEIFFKLNSTFISS